MGILTATRPGKALARLLGTWSTEVIPRDSSAIEAAPDLLPAGLEVFIAAAPGETSDQMVSAAARLRAGGLTPVPHVTARSLATLADADGLIGRLRDEAGLDRLLVLGGDRDRPAGELHSSRQVIESGVFARRGIRKLFLPCYPERHPRIAAEVLEAERAAKLRLAADQGLEVELVSQICFEPAPIVALARRLRTPYRVGVAGPADRTTLIRYALMCGVGPSLRALKHGQAQGVLARDTPERLLAEVATAREADPASNITGVHLFTFGGLADTVRWAERVRGA